MINENDAVIVIGDYTIDLDDYEGLFQPSTKVHNLSKWKEETHNLTKEQGRPIGDRLPWSKTHEYFRFRPKELTLWSGYNGHWKSMLIGQCLLNFVSQGKRCLIASFELTPPNLIHRLIRQAAGTDCPSELFEERFYEWAKDRLFIYAHEGIADRTQMRKVFNYAAAELKIDHVLIDSLMMCNISPQDYEQQKRFVADLIAYAKLANVHVHLVAHSKKTENEKLHPGKMDIHGSQDISNMASNILICIRNKKKEEESQKKDSDPKYEGMPDFFLTCEKQNYGSGLPRFGLWWESRSLQLTAQQGRAMTLLAEEIMA